MTGFKTACIKESNVASAAVENLNAIKFDDSDSSLKKFIFCLNKKLGLQNDAGEFQVEVIKKDLKGSEKDIEELLKICLGKKDTPAEAAYEALKCVRFNDPRKKKL